MPRVISAALQAEFTKVITSVGYLVHLGTATPKYWSNIGQVTWNSITWLDMDFSLSGLSFDVDAELTATMTIQNLDGQAGALFLGATDRMYDIPVTIYQFERDALAVADVPKIALMAINDATVEDQNVTVSLVESRSEASFAPRRRINSAHGFGYAPRAGSILRWGNEILTLESGNG